MNDDMISMHIKNEGWWRMSTRQEAVAIRKRILAVCVRLFLEQGYKQTSISQIVCESGVARGSFQNFFHTKDVILTELVKTMFGGQFKMARSIAETMPSPVYAYAVETSIQLAITELNENLREIYLEAYTLPSITEYIYLNTTAELMLIFGSYFPDQTENDFYEMEIGSAGLMRSYMAKKCDIHFPLERKLERFLTASLRIYKIPEDEQRRIISYVKQLDIKAIATEVMQRLLQMFEMKFDLTLTKPEETT